MGLFNSGRGGTALTYEEQMEQERLRQQANGQPPMTAPTAGGGLPRRSGLFSGGTPRQADSAPLNEMEGIRNALADNAMRPSPRRDAEAASPFASHHALHGRDEHGEFGPKKKKSDLQKIGDFVGRAALAWSAGQGNPVALYRLKQMDEQKSARKKSNAEYAEHHSLVRNLMSRNISVQDAELLAHNPDKLSEELASRYRTRDVAPKHSVHTPGLGSQPSTTWTAPDFIEDGPNYVQVDSNSGDSRTLYQGKTDAGWAAEESGLQPGTPSYQRFMQDIHLDGQGPTAVEMNQARIGAQNYRHTTPRATAPRPARAAPAPKQPSSEGGLYADIMQRWTAGGQVNPREREFVRAYELRRQKGGNGRRSTGSSGGRAATAVGPDGRKIVVRNGRWVDAQTGQPVQ